MSVLNYYAVQREAKTRAKNIGLSVVFSETKTVPCTDGRVMTLNKPTPNMTPGEEIVWWYMFEHELGHNHPDLQGTWDVLKSKKLSVESLLGLTFNLLEDHRQELYGMGQYKGRDIRIQNGFHQFLTVNMDASVFGKAPDPKRLAAETMLTADIDWRVEWMPKMAGVSERFKDQLTADQMAAYDKLMTGDYGNVLKSGIDEWECYNLALRILDEVFNIPPEEAEQEAQEKYDEANNSGEHDEGEGNSGSSEGQPGDGEDASEDGEGQGEADGEDGEDGDGKPKPSKVGYKVDYSDLLAHQHHPQGHEDGATYAPVEIDYSNWEAGHAWPQTDPDRWEFLDYVAEPATGERSRYGQKGLAKAAGNQLSKKVKRHLMIKGQARYEHAQKRGKISPKSLYRAGVGNGESSRKVFKKKQTSDILNTSVMVLVDFSGSMGGAKMTNASASMLLLNEAISPLGIPLEIIGFTDDYADAPKHGLLKSFNKKVSQEQLALNIGHFADKAMNANSDGESLLFAYERLLKQRSMRKILLILSDGQPASCSGDAYGHTIHVAKQIEKDGIVELCSIGILDSTVSSIYHNWKVINRSEELEEAVLDVIKTHIVKHS
jgi:hypothetical protein